MPDYKRVRLDDSGAHVTVGHVRAGMTVVDEPATDRNGRPLRATYPEQAGEPVVRPYADWSKAELEAEVEARNDARDGDDEPLVEVPAPGNKPDLVAALEADDAARA